VAVLPKARHNEEVSVGPSKQVRLIDPAFLSPFEEAIRGDETSTVTKGITEQGGPPGCLRAGVDREPSPGATHAPQRVIQDGLSALKIDHRAPLTRRNVVSWPELNPRLAERVERQSADESFFVGTG
jgi:hypothetical protein